MQVLISRSIHGVHVQNKAKKIVVAGFFQIIKIKIKI